MIHIYHHPIIFIPNDFFSVYILIYNTTREAFVLVKQFRPGKNNMKLKSTFQFYKGDKSAKIWTHFSHTSFVHVSQQRANNAS